MSATPSEMAFWSHKRSILFVERNQLAFRSGAGQPPGIRQDHEREQTGDLAKRRHRGEEVVNRTGKPNRLIRQIAALQVRANTAAVALIEDEVEHMQHGPEPFRSFRRFGMLNGTPEVLMHCLARLIRCAIVASGTRNA